MGKFSRYAGVLGSSALVLAGSAGAETIGSFNLYGNTGLIDMPSAQMQADGETSWTFGILPGTYRGTMNFQALPGLETSIRYSDIDGIGSGGSSLFGMSIDLKYQLFSEQGWRPSVAIGLRDFLGNGLYSSEYIVASKSLIAGMTVTGGVGWGRLGSYDGFGNPFGLDVRPVTRAGGGQFGGNQFFRGDAAFFGGLEWQTPLNDLKIKAEYSSDAYVAEVAGGGIDRASPFNFGLEYRPWNGVQIGAYYLHGSDIAFALTLSGNPGDPITPPDAGIGPSPVMVRPAGSDRGTGWAENNLYRNKVLDAVAEALSAEGVHLQSAVLRPKLAELRISNSRNVQNTKAIGRTARILALALPHSVETFRITLMESGMPVASAVIDRSAFEQQVDRPNAGAASWESTRIIDAEPELKGANIWSKEDFPSFSWSINPSVPIQFFNADQAVTYDVLLNFSANWQFSPGMSVSGGISQHLFGTTDENAAGSEYDRTSRPILTRLTADDVFKLNDDVYARASIGYFESRFAGIGGEVLWKPVNQNWGLGFDMNYVRQRDPDTYFGLLDYSVLTGHGSVYWDTGYHDVTAQVDLGRYTAGDWGGTVTLGRRFNNGWEVAGFVTMTDASYADYGPAAFDKGVRVSIPLRWTLPFETRSRVTIPLGSGSSEFGRRLSVGNRLYPDLRDYSELRFYENWGAFWQ